MDLELETLSWITQVGPVSSQGSLKRLKREVEGKVRLIQYGKDSTCCCRLWRWSKGDTSQRVQTASRSCKGKKIEFPPKSLEKHATLPTPFSWQILTYSSGLKWNNCSSRKLLAENKWDYPCLLYSWKLIVFHNDNNNFNCFFNASSMRFSILWGWGLCL